MKPYPPQNQCQSVTNPQQMVLAKAAIRLEYTCWHINRQCCYPQHHRDDCGRDSTGHACPVLSICPVEKSNWKTECSICWNLSWRRSNTLWLSMSELQMDVRDTIYQYAISIGIWQFPPQLIYGLSKCIHNRRACLSMWTNTCREENIPFVSVLYAIDLLARRARHRR